MGNKGIKMINLRQKPTNFPSVKRIINVKELKNDTNVLIYSGIDIHSEDFAEEVYNICNKHNLRSL